MVTSPRLRGTVRVRPPQQDFSWALVLLVDDDSDNRAILARGIARLGCRVLEAKDGQAALDLLRIAPVDLVLLDLMMPRLDGFAVLAELHADPALRAVPVIVTSALDDMASVVRAVQLGADDYLPKPCHQVLLRARIAASLEKRWLRAQEQAKHEQAERLLLNVLPAVMIERLRDDAGAIVDHVDHIKDATVLFADLVDFTRVAEALEPAALVALLSTVFTAFDRLVARYRVEKIKTIGDAYMAVAGVPIPRAGHTEVMARLALAMQGTLALLNARHGWQLELRIGLASGPLIAGVIGQQKFAYDLWGDTVNTAARMESLGVPGRIQISPEVYRRLRARFRCEPRGMIDVKGKGPLMTYFLLEPREPKPHQRTTHEPEPHVRSQRADAP